MKVLRKLWSSWTQMGIYPRLFLPILVLIILVTGIRYSLLIESESQSADARYQAEAQRLGLYLTAALPTVAGKDRRGAVDLILGGAPSLNPDLTLLRWDHGGQHLTIPGNGDGAARLPAWFRRLAGLGALQLVFPVRLADGSAGRLALTFSPTLPLLRVWDTLVRQATISLINIVLVYALLGLILAIHQAMLQRLAVAADRLQHGDYGVRMDVGGTREARALAHAFNNMAGEVQRLVTSLQASQKNLGDQLAQTQQMQSALQQMSWQNFHDLLTGLPNRSAMQVRFEHDLLLARERGQLLAVCLFDLDHFQGINDHYGAEAGDDILKQVAARLHAFCDQRHYAARLGGDEFVVLLAGETKLAEVERAVARLLRELGLPYQHQAQMLSGSVSAGVAVYHGDQLSADTLLRHADQALYQAKLTGRNKYHLFDAALDAEVRTHHNQRTAIRQALLAGQFRLHYQPKVDMRAGRVIGMEALLRWQHPQRGLIGPMHFLPLVDQTDLIIDIGEWVLRQALRQMQAWIEAGKQWVVSVNIAARHFQRPDFVARLRTILAEFPAVPARALELEILESSALGDVGHVRAVMLECQALGISFALDDFGTGYSSLSYLKRLPANVLKIDQSFVRNMLDDSDDLHLVGAVIGLARSFRLTVIAEGVETVAQGSRLMQMGCDLAQGYGIARPMPAEAVLLWASSFRPARAWRENVLLEAAANHRSGD